MYVESNRGLNPSATIVAIGDPSLAFASRNFISMAHNSGVGSRNVFDVRVNGNNSAFLTPTYTDLPNVFLKSAGAYKVNDFAFSLNGLNAVTDTSGGIPVVTGMSIGSNLQGFAGGGSTAPFSGTIRKLAYYPKRLTNAEIVALTQN
jgi:hypothetical protein